MRTNEWSAGMCGISAMFLVMLGLLAVFCLRGDGAAASPGTKPESVLPCADAGLTPEKRAPGQSPLAAGMRVYVDPETGKFVVPPTSESMVPVPRGGPRAAVDEEGLVEVPGATRGGGYTVNLKRRFRGSLTARATADGQVTMECLSQPGPAGGAE